MNEEEIDDLWCNQFDYFNMCVDKIYEYFQRYGYTWLYNKLPPTREEIEEAIKYQIGEAKESGYCSTGRITTEYGDDRFEVSITL